MVAQFALPQRTATGVRKRLLTVDERTVDHDGSITLKVRLEKNSLCLLELRGCDERRR